MKLKSDLSKVEAGDWVLALPLGWVRAKRVTENEVHLEANYRWKYWSYFKDGRSHGGHEYPTCFPADQVPECFLELYGPPPEKAKYEEKFIVFNKKHLRRLPGELLDRFSQLISELAPYLPDNKYYVCNQDEPYAEEVIRTILDGESKKDGLYGPPSVEFVDGELVWVSNDRRTWYPRIFKRKIGKHFVCSEEPGVRVCRYWKYCRKWEDKP